MLRQVRNLTCVLAFAFLGLPGVMAQAVVAYDNLACPSNYSCSAGISSAFPHGINVCYESPAAFFGGSAMSARRFDLGDLSAPRCLFQAPVNPDVDRLPTDIVLDDYSAGEWPAARRSDRLRVAAVEFAPFVFPTSLQPGLFARLSISFLEGDALYDPAMSVDGDIASTWVFGTLTVALGETGDLDFDGQPDGILNWFGYRTVHIDLVALGADIRIPAAGLIGLDFDNFLVDANGQPTAEPACGVAHMIAGGDLVHAAFPKPDQLTAAGSNDPEFWLAASGHPETRDDDGDGVISIGDVVHDPATPWVNWAFTIGSPNVESHAPHALPIRIWVLPEGSTACEGDHDGDGDTDLGDLGAILAGYGTLYDLANLGAVLADYGCGV